MTDDIKNPWEIIHSPYVVLGNSDLISKKVTAINQIANSHSPEGSIPYLLPLLLGNEFQAVKDEVAKSIPVLMKKMLKEHNYVISQGFKDRFRYINLTVSNISLLSTYEHSGVLLGIASLSEPKSSFTKIFWKKALINDCLILARGIQVKWIWYLNAEVIRNFTIRIGAKGLALAYEMLSPVP